MWNLLEFTIVTVCICAHQISAQRKEKLTAMNGYLKNIIVNAQIMQDIVQAELGQNIPNQQPNLTYDNFLEAGELRLQVLEDSTARLKTAIGSPNKICEFTPTAPEIVELELSCIEPPQLTMRWIPSLHTYGPLKNYTLHWGVKNESLRKELVDPTQLIWISDFLDDDTVYEFKLFAVNEVAFSDPAIRTFTTPKRQTIVPPNVTVDKVKGDNNTMLKVKWDPPLHPVRGYYILYKKIESVYSGRWQLKENNDPRALSSEIIVNEPENKFIVLVRGKPGRAPAAPRIVELELSRIDPLQLTMRWIPPKHTYDPLKNYTLHWGVKNRAVRKELIDPTQHRWISDFLDDDIEHEFKLFAVNDVQFSDPAIRTFTTPKRKTIVPPNVTVNRVKIGNNTTMLQVKWDPPLHPVRGYYILYREFKWVYSGRWQLKEINDPRALSSEIIVNEPENKFIVLVRGKPGRAPAAPRIVELKLSRINPLQLTMRWIPPKHTYGPLKNYTLHWGVKNGAVRKELIDPTQHRWISDFLDDDIEHEFKLFAVNDVQFSDPAIRTFTTPKRKTIVPPNVTVNRVKGEYNTTMLQVRWDPPLHPVRGYDILYRKFEWVYRGRWQLKEINDPKALSSEIIINKPENSFIVVVQGKPDGGRPPSFQQTNLYL